MQHRHIILSYRLLSSWVASFLELWKLCSNEKVVWSIHSYPFFIFISLSSPSDTGKDITIMCPFSRSQHRHSMETFNNTTYEWSENSTMILSNAAFMYVDASKYPRNECALSSQPSTQNSAPLPQSLKLFCIWVENKTQSQRGPFFSASSSSPYGTSITWLPGAMPICLWDTLGIYSKSQRFFIRFPLQNSILKFTNSFSAIYFASSDFATFQ